MTAAIAPPNYKVRLTRSINGSYGWVIEVSSDNPEHTFEMVKHLEQRVRESYIPT